MKQKILVGMLLQTLLFLVGGVYLAREIGSATDDVEGLVRLHQVEHLREHYLVQVHTVQSGLLREHALASAAAEGTTAAVAMDVTAMAATAQRCVECHHAPASTRRLQALEHETDRYRDALGRWSAAPAGSTARRAEADAAFRIGEGLIAEAAAMIGLASRSLEVHTLAAMDAIARTRWVVWSLVALGPLLSISLGVFCLRRLTRPFDALLQATRRLERGDLDHRVGALPDEFGELAHSFDAMARSLKEQLQLMQRTEQLVVVGELAAGLVHEIKNPLAGIKAAVQVLSREAQLSDEDREILQCVAREIVSLEGLLKGFLGFAKPAKPNLADVDVNALVESIVAFYLKTHATRAERPVTIVKRLRPIPPARLDPIQLQQVLLNLLLNAVEAMPEGGVIEVRTELDPRDGSLELAVADGGRGVPKEHAARVFLPFYTTKSGGTGLGLPVSKRLVEQHGGSLDFHDNPGGGTVFRIRLPVTAAEPVARSA